MANQYDVRKSILDAGLNYPINTNQMNNSVKNFSALNQPSGYSSLGQQQNAMGLVPNKNISFAPSNRQQINKANNRFSYIILICH